MKTFDIKVPKSAIDLRIKHYKALQLPKQVISDNSIDGKIAFVSALTGTKASDIRLLSVEQLDLIWKHGMMAFSGFKTNSEPPKEIILDGKKYERVDPKTVSAGWHIDWATLSTINPLEKDPVMLACMFYLPKGSKYGEIDENDNIVYPLSERYEVFKEHMPLQIFVESLAFFLNLWYESTKRYTDKVRGQRWMERRLKRIRPLLRIIGKRQ